MTVAEIAKIMETTCWKSLSYCCGLKKPCKLRDKAMKQLNMSPEEYEQLKTQFDKSLIKMLKKRISIYHDITCNCYNCRDRISKKAKD